MNEKGIALIIAMFVALIVLILGSIAIYLTIQSAKISGEFKGYTVAVSSADGALNQTTALLNNIKDGNFSYPSIVVISPHNKRNKCLEFKLNHSTADWTNSNLTGNYCSDYENVTNPGASSIKDYYDLKYSIGNGLNKYNIYIKVTNTSVGNTQSPSSNIQLSSGGTGASKSGVNILSPPPEPYLYTICAYAENVHNPNINSYVTIMFAY